MDYMYKCIICFYKLNETRTTSRFEGQECDKPKANEYYLSKANLRNYNQ